MAIFPRQSFDGNTVKAQWKERYTSEVINKKFLGMPRGVYAGFIPALDADPNKLQLNVDPTQGISLVRVQSGQENVMMDIITEDQIILDFSGHGDWPVYVIARADYVVGSTSNGSLITRKTGASGADEVNVCKIDRPGNQGALVISPSSVFPTNDVTSRQEPYAFDDNVGPPFTPGQNFGFLPKGSFEDLIAAADTTAEVEAARQFTNGVAGTAWSSGSPQTTGLPDRLNKDLSAKGMGDRLGKNFVSVRTNNLTISQSINLRFNSAPSGAFIFDETVTSATGNGKFQNITGSGPYYAGITMVSGVFLPGQLVTGGSSSSTATIAANTALDAITHNISGSFSARRRYSLVGAPIIDSSSSASLPNNPFVTIELGGSESRCGAITSTLITGATLLLTNISGTFITGEKISNTNAPAGNRVGVVQNYINPGLEISYIQGTFLASDVIVGNISGATATVSSVTAITLDDSNRNVCYVVNNSKGERFTDAGGNIAYGKLFFQEQAVLSGTLTFVNSNDTVTTSSNLTGVLRGGDIIQGADGRYYEVRSAVPTQITGSNFKIDPPYVGSNTAATGLVRRRYAMALVNKATGTERCSDLSTTTITAQAFIPAFLSHENSSFDSKLLMSAPGETPDATTVIKGKVALAPDLGTTAGTVVQANDSRVGTIKVQADGASTSTSKPLINIVSGTNISLSVDDSNPAKVSVTINAASGGAIPTPYGSTPNQDGTGSAGSSTSYARGDHTHPVSGAYRPASYGMKLDYKSSISNAAATATLPSGTDIPKLLICIGSNTTTISVGVAISTAFQTAVGLDNSGGVGQYSSTRVITSSAFGGFIATFGSPSSREVTINPDAVAGSWSKALFLLGEGN